MRVLVVGCGYLGLPLGAALVREGHQVWGLRRSAGAAPALREAGLEPVPADVTDPASLASLAPRFDWVVNCVASGGGTAEDYRRIYYDGTRNLLAWLAAAPPRRFVYTSSTGVYGQTAGEVVDETSLAEPDAPTARILRDTEELLLEAARTTGFPAIILRLAGIYGPGRGYWLRQFLAGEARIEGDGSRVLNLVHRDDAAGAIRAALERGEPGRIYNVVDDAPATQRELLTWLAETLERPLPPSVSADGVANRKRGLTSKRVSNRRLREELAFRPACPSFREGFAAELAG